MIDLNRARAHLQKAKDDLSEAQILLEASRPEGTCNRTYYSLYHCIIALLHTTDSVIPKNAYRRTYRVS